jgi:hypothetical protein
MEENIIKDIEKKEKEELCRIVEKEKVGEKFKALRERREELKKLYGEVYPEYKEVFTEKEPRYYRIAAAYASEYNEKDNPLLVFLRSDITNEEDFWNYFKYKPEDFLDAVRDGKIVPFIGPPRMYEENQFYIKFFNEWYKKLGFYPPTANRLETAILAGKNFEDYKKSFRDELKKLFKKLPEKVMYDPSRLPPLNTEDFFSERFAWFKLAKMDYVIEDVIRLLEKYAKEGNKELFNLAVNYTFSSHQIFTSHIFYSKGGYVVLSPEEDLPLAIETFHKIIQHRSFLETLAGKMHWIFLTNLLIEVWKRRKVEIPIMELPSVNEPKDAKNIQQEISKSEEIQREKEEVTRAYNETIYAAEGKNLSLLEEKYRELVEVTKNLGETYRQRFGATLQLLATALLGGVEVYLASLHPDIASIAMDYLVIHEGIEKALIERILERIRESRFRETLPGGIFGDLVIPLDIWKLGKRDLPVVYKKRKNENIKKLM